MDLMEYSDFCGAGDAGVDAAGCRRRRPTVASVRPRPTAAAAARPPRASPLPRSLARSLSQTSNLSVIFSFSNPGQYGQGERERPMQGNQEVAVNATPHRLFMPRHESRNLKELRSAARNRGVRFPNRPRGKIPLAFI